MYELHMAPTGMQLNNIDGHKRSCNIFQNLTSEYVKDFILALFDI